MVLMIDNYDSFTYNVVQYCRELGADLKIIRNDELTIDEIMSLEIKGKPIYGVQFHPESIMSEHGHEMLDNFLKL